MNPGTRSTLLFPPMVCFQGLGEPEAGQGAADAWADPHRFHSHGVLLNSKIDLVTRCDAQLVADGLWDYYLALWPNSISHTQKYNSRT